jgi:DNA-binding protein YbaB
MAHEIGREIDEAWIEDAIERYQRIEERQARFDEAVKGVSVTVRSPDGLVEVVVSADGTIKDVQINGSLHGRSTADLSRSLREAVTAAADAAEWARRKLHADTFGEYRPLS